MVVNVKYIDFVRTLPCSHCRCTPAEAHHIKGVGMSGFGTRAHDAHSMPLCRDCHSLVHQDVKGWPQARWMIETQLKAMDNGVDIK